MLPVASCYELFWCAKSNWLILYSEFGEHTKVRYRICSYKEMDGQFRGWESNIY
jgi:hypothetical protein